MGDTVTVRGEGGNIEQMDVPEEGTTRREIFDGMLAKGWLTILDGDSGPVPESADADEPAPLRTRAKATKVEAAED